VDGTVEPNSSGAAQPSLIPVGEAPRVQLHPTRVDPSASPELAISFPGQRRAAFTVSGVLVAAAAVIAGLPRVQSLVKGSHDASEEVGQPGASTSVERSEDRVLAGDQVFQCFVHTTPAVRGELYPH